MATLPEIDKSGALWGGTWPVLNHPKLSAYFRDIHLRILRLEGRAFKADELEAIADNTVTKSD